MRRLSHRRAIVVAIALWLIFAFVVWNVVFDRIIVLAGRRYSHDATVLYRSTGQYLLIDSVMRPAIVYGVKVASAVAGAIVVAALLLIRVATLRDPARDGPRS